MSFKRRLSTICLFFTFMPLIIMSIGNVWLLKDNTEKLYTDMLVQCADMQHTDLEHALNHLFEQVHVMSGSPYNNNPLFLQAYTQQTPYLTLCGIVDGQGNLLVTNLGSTSSIGKNIISQEQLEHTQRMTPYIEAVDGFMMIDKIQGDKTQENRYWVSVFDSDLLRDLLKDYLTLQDSYSFFMDSNGKIIGHPETTLNEINDVADPPSYTYLKNRLDGNDETPHYYYRYNIKKIGVHHYLDSSDWMLITTMTTHHGTLYTLPLIKQMTIIMALSVIVIYILLKHSLDSIFELIEELITTIKTIEQGNLDARFEYFGKDELGGIARSFNQLMEKQTTTLGELKVSQDKLIKLATYDALTNVYNRSVFEEQAQCSLKTAQTRGELMVLLFIDIDCFKQINDDYGHKMGDVVLETIGKNLTSYVGKNGFVGRFGGDEFIICLTSQLCILEIDLWIKQLQQLLEDIVYHDLSGQQFSVGCSIGYATYPAEGLTYDTLIHCADDCMYRTKKQRKGGIV
ncbi:MAG: sensor domain-containing diguanylate cyclase [Cellulosilyticaceae bacterium]